MKKYTVIEMKDDNSIWVVVDVTNLCQCICHPVDCTGTWIACFNPNCADNDLDEIKILKS
jgi:hypothetical protein